MLKSLKIAKMLMMSAACALLLASCGGSSGDGPAPGVISADESLLGGDDSDVIDEPERSPVITERAEYITPMDIAECSSDDIKGRVDFDMRDYYIYYDQVPLVASADFDTPESFIRALRVDPDIYSFVTDESEFTALFDDGMLNDYGIRFNPASDGVVRFREILGGSPGELAGIQRGDELIRLNDRLISEFSNDELREAFGEDRSQISVQVRTADEPARENVLNRETFQWRTARSGVSRTEGLPTVGYLQIRTFLETTEGEIDIAIASLLESDIDDLILDLRYNPGGRTRVAERLAVQIVGPSLVDQPFLVRTWNDKYSENNSTSILESAEPALALPRVIVLLTENSASASEALVNGLEPYTDVIVIGGVTRGKIFTSNSREYCGKAINAMRSIRTNSVGVSILGGIEPDCRVADDWTQPATSNTDALTSAALTYVVEGRCPDVASAHPNSANRNRASGPAFRGTSELLDTPMDLID